MATPLKTAPASLIIALCLSTVTAHGDPPLNERVVQQAEVVEPDVIQWRRDIHENPELSNREFKTAKKVADHLRSLGIDVQTEIAHTGVVGILEGGKPGPVVALRADMDALPVVEKTGLPFASEVTTTYNGREVGVMHACGHDAHVAILMGAAEVLASMKDDLPGTIKFIFQPAEEGAPEGEEGGAELMVDEGVLENPRPDAIFGLHVTQGWEVGQIAYRTEGAMASSDFLRITVTGTQTHAAQPWAGTDPIVVGAQIVTGLQTIVSRRIDITNKPAIVTIGTFHGGTRNNIIPSEVEMTGTIRAFTPYMREQIHDLIRTTATNIAESHNATADVEIQWGYPVTFNDSGLAKKMHATLESVVGAQNVTESPLITGAEDFSYYQKEIPGLFFFLGVRSKGTPQSEAIPNHSPYFTTDEDALVIGVKALAQLATDYMQHQ